MPATRKRSARFSAWLVRAFENPATSVVPPLRDYPVAVSRRNRPLNDGW
jgi:hypothetical protein